ncbi:MATE family efflux transporter [candidate division WOR-3 bacterium]|nr:MATE family efflux transporter [candidate division WOR-3 bacterium]
MISVDLTNGSILPKIIKVALPVIGTSIIHLAYGVTDMLWIGKLSSEAVAAVGTASFLVWLGFSFILVSKVGAEIWVAQSIGRNDFDSAVNYARNALQINLISAVFYGLFIFFSRKYFIAFYGFERPDVVSGAEIYAAIISFGTIFMFVNPVLSGIFNGTGNSKTPFVINSIGIIANIVLDPFLIFGLLGFPKLGVAGAALSTILSQALVTLIFVVYMRLKRIPFKKFQFFKKMSIKHITGIVKFGSPVALQSMSFTLIAILLARVVARYGALPIAAQKIGIQVEGISYMTASGFSTALCAFTGQNFGTLKWNRIVKGYSESLVLMTGIGIISFAVLFFFPDRIMSFFVKDAETINHGVSYLKILSFSQIFMCFEITSAGAFNGIGKTLPPSIVSIIFTGLRIPAAYFLSEKFLGLDGVWWSISVSSVFKGIVLMSWFIFLILKQHEIQKRDFIPSLIYRWNAKYFKDKLQI